MVLYRRASGVQGAWAVAQNANEALDSIPCCFILRFFHVLYDISHFKPHQSLYSYTFSFFATTTAMGPAFLYNTPSQPPAKRTLGVQGQGQDLGKLCPV